MSIRCTVPLSIQTAWLLMRGDLVARDALFVSRLDPDGARFTDARQCRYVACSKVGKRCQILLLVESKGAECAIVPHPHRRRWEQPATYRRAPVGGTRADSLRPAVLDRAAHIGRHARQYTSYRRTCFSRRSCIAFASSPRGNSPGSMSRRISSSPPFLSSGRRCIHSTTSSIDFACTIQ